MDSSGIPEYEKVSDSDGVSALSHTYKPYDQESACKAMLRQSFQNLQLYMLQMVLLLYACCSMTEVRFISGFYQMKTKRFQAHTTSLQGVEPNRQPATPETIKDYKIHYCTKVLCLIGFRNSISFCAIPPCDATFHHLTVFLMIKLTKVEERTSPLLVFHQ